jgi:bifunctional non-homologous end joining protein LigD
VGYYDGRDLVYAGRIRAGLSSELRSVLLLHFEEHEIARCPFRNPPDRGEGRWGEGLTAAEMAVCRWLDSFLVTRLEFLKWTPDNRLRHPRFVGIRSDKDALDIIRE